MTDVRRDSDGVKPENAKAEMSENELKDNKMEGNLVSAETPRVWPDVAKDQTPCL